MSDAWFIVCAVIVGGVYLAAMIASARSYSWTCPECGELVWFLPKSETKGMGLGTRKQATKFLHRKECEQR